MQATQDTRNRVTTAQLLCDIVTCTDFPKPTRIASPVMTRNLFLGRMLFAIAALLAMGSVTQAAPPSLTLYVASNGTMRGRDKRGSPNAIAPTGPLPRSSGLAMPSANENRLERSRDRGGTKRLLRVAPNAPAHRRGLGSAEAPWFTERPRARR